MTETNEPRDDLLTWSRVVLWVGVCEIAFLLSFLLPLMMDAAMPSAYFEARDDEVTDQVRYEVGEYAVGQARLTRFWILTAAGCQIATSATVFWLLKRLSVRS